MIRVKNGGEISLQLMQGIKNVSEGYIRPIFQQKGWMTAEIRFTGNNPDWHEPIEVEPAIEPDKVNNIPGKPAVIKECLLPKTMEVGYIHLEEFECNHEGDVLGKCTEEAIRVLGPNIWESFGLKNI